MFFFFKQKTAYEMRISDWSSDVCSSDLVAVVVLQQGQAATAEELLALLKDKLARYKQPRRVFFWDALPKSGYGTVPKHLLRNELYAPGALIQPGARSVQRRVGPEGVSTCRSRCPP